MAGTVHAMTWSVNSRPQVWAGGDQAVSSLTVVELPPATFTDVNLDGVVDAADLAAEVILVEQWQVPPPPWMATAARW